MFMFVKSDRSNETLIPTTNNDHVTVGGGRGGRRVSFGSGCGGCGIGGVVVAVVVEEFVITVVVAVALVAVVAVVAWRGHPYGSRRLVLALALVRGSLGGSGCVASIHTSSKSHRTAIADSSYPYFSPAGEVPPTLQAAAADAEEKGRLGMLEGSHLHCC